MGGMTIFMDSMFYIIIIMGYLIYFTITKNQILNN